VVATTRLLDSQRARQAGGFYSESEFQLVGLAQLRGDILEIGRTCVHADYRNGATISVLWSGIAQLMNERHYSYLNGLCQRWHGGWRRCKHMPSCSACANATCVVTG